MVCLCTVFARCSGFRLGAWSSVVLALACSGGVRAGEADTFRLLSPTAPAVLVGDRLFRESRFAQFFFAHCHGDVNAVLREGDAVVDELPVAGGAPRGGPNRGRSMSCRQCHLGDDLLLEDPLAGRTYCDFSRLSPIPRRSDGRTLTERNSPLMVNVDFPRTVPQLLHFDGEFAGLDDLVIETLTGRNFGWLFEEVPAAVAHIAKVVREDEGQDPRLVTYARGGGIPYRAVMLGTDPEIPPALRLSETYRLDVTTASDDRVLHAVAGFIRAYVDSLRFGTQNTGRESKSPYDVFLEKNALPRAPRAGESGVAYARRLALLVERRKPVVWVTADDGELELHEQEFRFGERELQGLRIFFGAGNCVACHHPPQFTDYRLHNNGVSQATYDAVFGRGAFAALEVPGLAARNARFDAYLPPSPGHPHATARFRTAPAAAHPGHADLGVWNIFANPDVPKPQTALTRILCAEGGVAPQGCRPATVLPLTIALFKTPSVRDLGQSNPYFHSGTKDTIEDVLRFYVATSDLARAGKLRNGAPEMARVHVAAADIAPLAAFLRALNEDYR